MGVRSRLFAATYDRQMRKTEAAWLGARRRDCLGAASGDVLEIGAGTGGNLSYYGTGVTSLTLTDPEPGMVKRLQRHALDVAPETVVLRAPAEDLPFDDQSFDTVVSTMVLCGVSDQARALREVRRVLRPGGQFLFIEHVRADDAKLAHHQDRMNWFNRLVVCCECNRPTLQSIADGGFTVRDVEHFRAKKVPKFVSPWMTGHAQAGETPPS